MKRILVLILALALSAALFACGTQTPAATPSGSAEPISTTTKVLRVGMECAYAPYNWTQLESSDFAVKLPDGTYAEGYDVQIAKLIAEKLGYTLEVVKTDWEGLPPSLTSNKIDLIIAGMTDTPERRETIDFTDVYWSSDLYIVLRKDSPYADATSLADFAGAKITGQLDTIHYDMVDKIPGVDKQQAIEDFPTMLIALGSGKIDGYVSEWPAAYSATLSNSDVTFIGFEGDKGFGEEVPVSIGIRKGEDDLKQKINAILAELSDADRLTLMQEAVARQPLS